MTLLAKVCGLTRPEDVAFAAAQGADLLGFVSHPASQRHCADLALASPWLDRAVLVMVADRPETILAQAHSHGFRWVQPYLPAAIREYGLRLLQSAGHSVLLPWADEPGQLPLAAELYVWETSATVTGLFGGSGQVHAMAFPPPGDFILAGGLEAGNLLDRAAQLPAADRVRLRGVDAASRLEAAPGRKDPAMVAAFIRTAHALEIP